MGVVVDSFGGCPAGIGGRLRGIDRVTFRRLHRAYKDWPVSLIERASPISISGGGESHPNRGRMPCRPPAALRWGQEGTKGIKPGWIDMGHGAPSHRRGVVRRDGRRIMGIPVA